MTMLFSCATEKNIVMAADSAELIEFSTGEREYNECLKAKSIGHIGCIGTWGARDHNKIFDFIDNQSDSPETVDQLVDLVNSFLTSELKPNEIGLGDVGYHVAGFNPEGEPRLYHIFWGFDVPRPDNQEKREYRKYNHSPTENEVQFLYNGRSELAHTIMKHFLGKITKDKSSRIDIKTSEGLIKLADLVTRFSAEITKEVAPPFQFFLISPGKFVSHVKNESMCPLKKCEIEDLVR